MNTKTATRRFANEGINFRRSYHDLLNDLDKEVVMKDITDWIDARIPALQTKSAGA